MKKICVILASYNGSKWIKKQIKSILSQEKVIIDLFINDDCSKDNTLEILKDISKNKKNIFINKSKKNSGSAGQNFINLILKIDFKKYDYISFSDQDDLWEKNKLRRAILMINKLNVDCYSSDVTILFKNGKTAYLKKSQNQKKFDFLFEGGGPGSTFVMNKKFMINLKNNLKTNIKVAKKIIFHDWYIYFFARINRYKWFIDNFSGLKYRQHEKNELGANVNFKTKLIRLKYILSQNFFNQLKYFFLLNKDQKKNYQFLFSMNKLNTFFFIIKNFHSFRRKNTEKIACFFILLIILIRRKKLV